MTHPGALLVSGAALALVFGVAAGQLDGRLPLWAAGVVLVGVGARAVRDGRGARAERDRVDGRARDLEGLMEFQTRELALLHTRIASLDAELAEEHRVATVGRLAAGMAHQATLPLAGISDDLSTARDAFKRLQQHIGALHILVVQADPRGGAERLDQADHSAGTRRLLLDAPLAIARAEEGITRASGVLRAVQDFATPSDRRPADVDVASCVDTAVEVCRDRWSRIASLSVHHDAGLPRVPVVRGELNEALVALILNAADAIHARSPDNRAPEGRIDVRVLPAPGGVAIHVADDGIGISREQQEQLLRAQTGGLARLRRTILAHVGGELTMQSEPGVGTTMRLMLPEAGAHFVQVELSRAAK